jgi:ApaG protein
VQLTSRHWEIFDSLNDREFVDGDGVIGKKPVLKPGESHSYSSGCLLASPFGAMKGYFNMINFTSTRSFKVIVPTFKLSAPFALN